MKAEFYPRVDKIAAVRGRLHRREVRAQPWQHGGPDDRAAAGASPTRPYVPGEPLVPCYAPQGERFPDNSIDMGTGYDCFDTLSHTMDPRVKGEQRANRHAAEEHAGAGGLHQPPRGVVALHLQAGGRSPRPTSTSPWRGGRSSVRTGRRGTNGPGRRPGPISRERRAGTTPWQPGGGSYTVPA